MSFSRIGRSALWSGGAIGTDITPYLFLMQRNRVALMPLRGELGAVLDDQGLESHLQMLFHGQDGNIQLVGNLLVVHAGGHEFHNGALAMGELLHAAAQLCCGLFFFI